MKTAAFAMALLLAGGAALAQTAEVPAGSTPYDGDGVTEPFETGATAADGRMATTIAATGDFVRPSNADPERDARGIAVISAPAVVPAGWNGTAGSAMGGPLIDPATGAPVVVHYLPCTAAVTDHCLQTYERGRR